MAKQDINLGSAPSGAGGDTRRSAFSKCIANFNELYSLMTGKLGRNEVVGTAADGAVMETGSNTRGRWTKFADGTMIQVFNVWNTGTIPANGYPSQEVDLPTACLGNSESAVMVQPIPSQSNDHYGILSAQLINATKIQFILRNGPVAQVFSMRCTVITRWK